MAKSFSRKYRIFVTRLFTAILVCLLVFSDSRWEDTPIICGIIFLVGAVMVGLATVGRLWCALYISGYKSNTLITTGPYSISRNPLYFFSLIGAVGVGLTTETLLIPLITIICFAILYPYVVLSEQKKLAGLHKEAFAEYCKKVPAFFPSFKLFNEPDEYVVQPVIFRKAMFSVLWFVWLLGVAEFAEALHDAGILPVLFNLY